MYEMSPSTENILVGIAFLAFGLGGVYLVRKLWMVETFRSPIGALLGALMFVVAGLGFTAYGLYCTFFNVK